MDLRRRAFLSGAMASVLAVVIIVSATYLGLAPVGSESLTPNATGNLSVLLADPPSVPDGVSAVFMSYDNLQVHAYGFPQSSGWISLGSSGTVETLGLAQQGQVITSARIPSGTYDEISLNITGSRVLYAGRNYTATVQSPLLRANLVGNLVVAASGTSTAFVDLQPLILKLGTAAAPAFLANTAAVAAEVPSDQVKLPSLSVGSRVPLASATWFTTFLVNNTRTLTIGSASVTTASLSLTLSNPGAEAVNVKMIVVTPSLGPVASSAAAVSPSLVDSAIFIVTGNGSLQFVRYIGPSVQSLVNEVQQLTATPGYNMPPGSSLSMSFNGALSLSFGGSLGARGPAAFYTISIVGTQVLAKTTVKSG